MAKSASARLCLALAAGSILLVGCGGGSSDPVATGGTESQAAENAQSKTTNAASEKKAAAPTAGKKSSHSATTAAGRSSSGAGSKSAKHGPHIAQPKGKPEQAPTPASIATATVADMSLSSPSLPAGSEGTPLLSTAYTCDGKDEWPVLSWSGVPAGSAELIVYAMNVAPVAGKLFVDWAVAGIDPALTGIEAGKLPKDAVVGTNSFGKRGYEICPEGSETYIFAVYALPRALSPQAGFDARELRKKILDVSGNVGLLSATYTRR